MRRYRRKPEVVEAWQFPTEDCPLVCTRDLATCIYGEPHVHTRLSDDTSLAVRLFRGAWIVRREDGRIETCSDERFRERWEPVEEDRGRRRR